MSRPAENALLAGDAYRAHLDALPGVGETDRADIKERAWVDDWKPDPEE